MSNVDRAIEEIYEQTEVRRQKLAKLQDSGHALYHNHFRPTFTRAYLVSKFGGTTHAELTSHSDEIRVAGRILGIRKMGKASFFHIHDRRGRIQVYARKDRLGNDAYASFQSMDVGDVVGVHGRLFRTKTKELTIEAEGIRLLAKCLRPLPEKWHGLADVEARYRQRYLDLMVNPDVRDVFEKRSRII